MTQQNELLKELYSLLHGSMTHNTDRIEKIANYLHNPQTTYPIIHVAGTNGKGSVCSLLASILQESGLKVGLYTSPHIIEFNERIRINGTKISDENINHFYYKIRNFAFDLKASFFEITTAMAFDYFADNQIDIAVIETGLGGRLDSTNIVNPIATLITTIDKDHCDLLGNTIEEIASEKAGIIKPNVPWLLQDNNPTVRNIFKNKAAKLNAPAINDNTNVECLQITKDFKMKVKIDWTNDNWQSRNLKSTTILSDLIGKHQIQNIKTAVLAAIFLSKQIPNISINSITNGIQNVIINTNFHFRIECVSKAPLVIIDISHNQQSIAALCKTIAESEIKSKWNVIFGVMKDKSIESMLTNILPICNKLIIVEAAIDRSAKRIDVQNIATLIGFADTKLAQSIANAVAEIPASNHPTLICGSFYIMEEVITALRKLMNSSCCAEK